MHWIGSNCLFILGRWFVANVEIPKSDLVIVRSCGNSKFVKLNTVHVICVSLKRLNTITSAHRQTNKQTGQYKKIAVASVTVWRSIFALASCLLRSRAFCLLRSHAFCLLRSRAFCSLRSRKFSTHKKMCVSIDSKCSETHRNAQKKFLPL